MLSFSISYWDLIKSERGDRGWKHAQRQGKDRVTLGITLLHKPKSRARNYLEFQNWSTKEKKHQRINLVNWITSKGADKVRERWFENIVTISLHWQFHAQIMRETKTKQLTMHILGPLGCALQKFDVPSQLFCNSTQREISLNWSNQNHGFFPFFFPQLCDFSQTPDHLQRRF